MKSNSIVKARSPYGSNRVEKPRDVSSNAMAQEWFTGGDCASATFPTTCVHMWRVAYVSFQPSYGSGGQASIGDSLSDLVNLCRRAHTSMASLTSKQPR